MLCKVNELFGIITKKLGSVVAKEPNTRDYKEASSMRKRTGHDGNWINISNGTGKDIGTSAGLNV